LLRSTRRARQSHQAPAHCQPLSSVNCGLPTAPTSCSSLRCLSLLQGCQYATTRRKQRSAVTATDTEMPTRSCVARPWRYTTADASTSLPATPRLPRALNQAVDWLRGTPGHVRALRGMHAAGRLASASRAPVHLSRDPAQDYSPAGRLVAALRASPAWRCRRAY